MHMKNENRFLMLAFLCMVFLIIACNEGREPSEDKQQQAMVSQESTHSSSEDEEMKDKARLVSIKEDESAKPKTGPQKLASKYNLSGVVYKPSEVNRVAIYEPECLGEKNPLECSSEEIYSFMVKNIRYPKEALDENLQTVSIIQFVVDKNGKVSDTKFVSSNGNRCVSCEKAALQAFGEMHNWVPAQKNGRAVAVEMTLPVRFRIEES